MYLKFYKLTFLFFLFPLLMFSQVEDIFCATIDDDIPDPAGAYSYAFDGPTLSLFEPVVLNVFFWGINQDDGTSSHMLTETMALKAVADLNIKYNEANIFFKYNGFDHINSSQFHIIYGSLGENTSEYVDFQPFIDANPEYNQLNSINIYVPRTTNGFAGYGNVSDANMIINSYVMLNGSNIINHEMGHVLNLKHTHRLATSTTFCEHVTRDPSLVCDPNQPDLICFNATTKGDYVVDTAAMPDFRNERCRELGYDPTNFDECPYVNDPSENHYYYLDVSACTYENINGADCQDTPYNITEEDVRNLMSYTTGPCASLITTGQFIRMREYIVDATNGNLLNKFNEVPSLYKPYKGEYYLAGASTSHNPPLFQPGFEYRFVECEGDYPAPSDYEDISFPSNNGTILATYDKNESDYNSITHPNHSAILLKHELGSVFFPQARKCYDNYNKASIGGLVMKFNDNVINANVTITPQDSTAINNQNLIQNLPSGLYKIEKNYEDGAVEETIIIKEQ